MQNINDLNADIDEFLKDSPPRNITPLALRTILKKCIQYVSDLSDGRISAWFKIGAGTPSLNGTDDVYRTGTVVIGQTTSDNTESKFVVKGQANIESFYAPNLDDRFPKTNFLGGSSILSLVGNWISGASDLGFVNTNQNSSTISFWRMPTATSRKLMLTLRDGWVGVGTVTPTESIDTTGRIKTTGLVANGNPPTVMAGAGLGTGGSASIIAGSTDQAGRVRLTTGTTPSGNALFATVTFNISFDAAPKFVMFTPRNQPATRELNKFYVDGMSTTQMVIYGSNGGNPTASTVYEFDYFIIK